MVSNYKRRSTQSAYGPDALQKALDAVKGGMSKNKASKQFSIPRRTLNRHLAGKVMKPLCKLGRFAPALGTQLEEALEQHILEMQQMMFGLSCTDVRKLAFQVAVKRGLKHPFSSDKQQAGKAWLHGFLQRHPTISVRTPEATNLSRAVGFNKPTVMNFFDMYKNELQKHSCSADRIWNVDETGISTVHVPGKVMAKKGQRQVGRITSGERGDNLTIICAINAAGSYAPPMLIFKRKRMSHLLMAGTPPGSVGYPSASGWVTSELFVKWLEHFIGFAKPTVDKKVILVLDGHASHKTLETVELCRENGVVLVCLPPHTTHQMQPLDKTVYGPLKRNYNDECDRWMLKNPAQRITMFEQGALFGAAFVKTAGMQKAVHGFERTGLWPFNPDVFCDEDFLPSQVTEEPEPVPSAIMDEADKMDAAADKPASPAATITEDSVGNNVGISLVLTCHESPADSSQLSSEEVTIGQSTAEMASSDTVDLLSSIHVLSPVPKCQKQRTRKRKPQTAAVLTSSPFKKQLMDRRPPPKQSTILPSDGSQKKDMSGSKKKTGKKVTCRGQKDKPRKLPLPREPKKRKQVSEQPMEFYCIYCSELFVEPPTEEWKQCIICKEWCHEQCGNETDICDLCTDSQ